MTTKLDKDLIRYIESEKDKCTGCKACMTNCPMLNTFCESPKTLMEDIIEKEQVAIELPFSCTLCGLCTHVCQEDVDLKTLFYTLREESNDQHKGKLKGIASGSVMFHQKNSFSKNFSTGVEGLKEKTKSRVFFPGCSLVAYDPKLVMNIYKDLKSKYEDIGIMLNCCGNPTHVMGDTQGHQTYFEPVAEELKNHDCDELIVACPNCYRTISQNSQQEVISLWQVLADRGLPKGAAERWLHINDTFAIHDPCPTRHNLEVHEAVRKITDELGISLLEMTNRKEKTLCCGSGGMLKITNNNLAVKQMKTRAEETEADHILSYCQECVESLKFGGKNTVHILDLIYNEKIYDGQAFNQKKQSTSKRWLNRYMAKKKVMKMFMNEK